MLLIYIFQLFLELTKSVRAAHAGRTHAVIKHAGFSGFSSVPSRLVGLSRGIQTQPRNPTRFIPPTVGNNYKTPTLMQDATNIDFLHL